MSGITKHEADMQYLQGNLHIDMTADKIEVLEFVRDEHKLPTTSWVFDALAEEWGKTVDEVRAMYRELLVNEHICEHGFFVDKDNQCPYCKWGTD